MTILSIPLDDLVKILHNWQIYTIVLVMLLSPFILELFKQKSQKRSNTKLDDSIKLLINSINVGNIKMNDRFESLIDILYERFANNITVPVAVEILDLVYNRSKLLILEEIHTNLDNRENYNNNEFRIGKFETNIKNFISNRYYMDCMTLHKLTCKGVTLDFHITKKVKHDDITNLILRCMGDNKNIPIEQIYREVKIILDIHFTTLTSKAKTQLDLITALD